MDGWMDGWTDNVTKLKSANVSEEPASIFRVTVSCLFRCLVYPTLKMEAVRPSKTSVNFNILSFVSHAVRIWNLRDATFAGKGSSLKNRECLKL
jgi:hypothetical protein